MKKHQTDKHRKQTKKERANRRAKREIRIVPERKPDAPVSPARRAFEDV